MSWQSYIDNMKTPDASGKAPVEDAAICGMDKGAEGVWASTPGFSGITAAEIKRLAAADRKDFGQNGPTIAGMKCRLIRDNLDTDGLNCLDMKSSADADGNAYNVCVGKSVKALVIAKGTKEANGGQVSGKVFSTVEHLRKSNY
ncbi:profilin-1 [Scomber japonicus]|uniref:profilin-1 n=1 Tax=Scomber japonicus TaxID=13676 RepID=UPI002304E7CF|nr:profilin-1 [Scomber japonicus]